MELAFQRSFNLYPILVLNESSAVGRCFFFEVDSKTECGLFYLKVKSDRENLLNSYDFQTEFKAINILYQLILTFGTIFWTCVPDSNIDRSI